MVLIQTSNDNPLKAAHESTLRNYTGIFLTRDERGMWHLEIMVHSLFGEHNIPFGPVKDLKVYLCILPRDLVLSPASISHANPIEKRSVGVKSVRHEFDL